MEEYHFDGFRFDGVTSMLYHSHGLGENFRSLADYFTMNTDTQAVTYLQLANQLIAEVKPGAVTIAEDMSGMPGMCVPVMEGGIGFNYRLAMGLPALSSFHASSISLNSCLVASERQSTNSSKSLIFQYSFRVKYIATIQNMYVKHSKPRF